ncbi:hypothetical protein [Streptomyces sp. T12]|uniref:hypothetical protein n=1 Tax=Streptomyces sp. T12 TaxID=477697 RepID=UPI0035A2B2D3
MVEANGGDGGGVAVGEVGVGAFGVLLGPAASRVRAGDAQASGQGGEQGLVEGVDEVGQGLCVDGLGVCPCIRKGKQG